MTQYRINWDVEVENDIFVDNAPKQTGFNKEIQRVERLERMYVRTTDPRSPWENKAEIAINIIKGKSKRRRDQRNIPKRVWDFGIILESGIYYRTEFKDGLPAL